jgi:diacylglycerol kinase family enzyme
MLREEGAEVDCFGLDEIDAVLEEGSDRLVVAGGDGSIAPVAAAASRAAIPLAVVPTGTANDFAAALGLPEEISEACSLAAHGQRTTPVDLARMGERPFLNVASIGLAPVAARQAESAKRAFGPLAYAWGAVRAGLTAEPVLCRISSREREVFAGKVWQATIACSGAFGGGADVEADADDGMLDAVAIGAGSRARLAKIAYGLRAGRIESHQEAWSLRSPSFRIELPAPTSFNLDGEVVESGSVDFTVQARAFKLVVA